MSPAIHIKVYDSCPITIHPYLIVCPVKFQIVAVARLIYVVDPQSLQMYHPCSYSVINDREFSSCCTYIHMYSVNRPLNNAEPLSSLETNTLQDYINRFVRGFYDKSVMQEAMSQGVLITDSLQSGTAIEIVRRSSAIQCVKTDIARRASP
ncbi:hypothetical protein E4U30_004312 [Claviceps sp. LM220 group G6]|nr:hypothetical protein E4U30_004312 [Claviceps sp. LM220 group G6]